MAAFRLLSSSRKLLDLGKSYHLWAVSNQKSERKDNSFRSFKSSSLGLCGRTVSDGRVLTPSYSEGRLQSPSGSGHKKRQGTISIEGK
jgi:hypothetical protein